MNPNLLIVMVDTFYSTLINSRDKGEDMEKYSMLLLEIESLYNFMRHELSIPYPTEAPIPEKFDV